MSTEFIPAAAEALVIRPGDVLILRFKDSISANHAQAVKDRLGDVLGLDAASVVVVCCDQIAVFRDE